MVTNKRKWLPATLAVFPLLVMLSGVQCNGQQNATRDGKAIAPKARKRQVNALKIMITLPDKILTGSLDASPAAQAFSHMLPLTLTLEDYAETEKISDLPAKLPSQYATNGYTPVPGDIAYYAPWGNLAIFYKSFRHSPGLVRLGRINSGM